METSFFLRGLLIGLSVAAVVGPISILCIQRTLQKGFLYGLLTGLGAATADAFYGGLAAFGLTLISTFLLQEQSWIRLVGGLFLIYLGLKASLSRPAEHSAQGGGSTFLGIYALTVLLTLTNPLTILSFAAVFAGIGLVATGGDERAAVQLIVGVFSGSSLWWLLLSGGVSLLREKLTPRWLSWINRLAGIALAIFGLLALLSTFF